MSAFTLSPEARSALVALADERGVTQSALVEALIRKACGLRAAADHIPRRPNGTDAAEKRRAKRK